jgi:excisionase family DNA binding protein
MSRRTHSSSGVPSEGLPEEIRGVNRRRQPIRFYTIADTAEMLRISTRTIRRWIDSGQLVAHVFGLVRIAEPDFREKARTERWWTIRIRQRLFRQEFQPTT